MTVLSEVAAYLANKLGLAVGINVFAYALPDSQNIATNCIAIIETKPGIPVRPQIPVDIHYISIQTRAADFITAEDLAKKCKYFLTYEEDGDDNATGIINFSPELCAAVEVQGNPVLYNIDQAGRKYFVLHALMTTRQV